jgi:hypothetical protein
LDDLAGLSLEHRVLLRAVVSTMAGAIGPSRPRGHPGHPARPSEPAEAPCRAGRAPLVQLRRRGGVHRRWTSFSAATTVPTSWSTGPAPPGWASLSHRRSLVGRVPVSLTIQAHGVFHPVLCICRDLPPPASDNQRVRATMLCSKLATSIIVAPFIRRAAQPGGCCSQQTQPRLPSSTALYQAQQGRTSRPVGLCLTSTNLLSTPRGACRR